MKTNIVWSHLMMAIVMVLTMTMTSCKWPWDRSDDDENVLPECYVNKNNLSFDSKKGDIKELSITCSGKWEISNVPDWLIAESTEGRGFTTVKFTTSVSNGNSSPNEGYMKVTFSENPDATETVYVEQRGGAVANCKATPNLIVALTNGIALDFNFDKEVTRYYCGCMKKSSVGKMTDEQIINRLESDFEPHVPGNDEVLDFDGLNAGTRYVIYTLGFNHSGDRGELLSKEVLTMDVMNNEPVAKIENLKGNGTYWTWSTRKATASCNGYYMMTTENYSLANASDVCQAWLMEYAIQNASISQYVNNADWQQKVGDSSRFFVWTRGVDASGTLSGVIEWKCITSTTTRSATAMPSYGIKSEKEKKIQNFRKPSPDQYQLYIVK